MNSEFDSTGYKKRTACAICSNTDLPTVLSYGLAPLAGEFLKEEDLGKETLYPLEFLFCQKCCLFQTDGFIDPDILFKDYRYMSSFGLTNHFKDVASYIVKEFDLSSESRVLDVGSNDGVLLKPLNDMGIPAFGIDPAQNISEIARSHGCDVVIDYFSLESAKQYFEKESFDVVTSCNCFAHIENIHEIIKGVKYVMKPSGFFMIEVHYIKNLMDQISYDNLYSEHIYEYSLTSLNYLFNMHGMEIVKFEEIPVHAGSIRVVAMNSSAILDINKSELVKAMHNEQALGLTSLFGFKEFSKLVNNHSSSINQMLTELSQDGKKIIGYGASGRANMLSHIANLNDQLIQYIVDESPERAGRYLSRTHIPVKNKEYFDNDPIPPDYIFIFAWNFSKMIIEKLQGRGFKFIIPFPEPRIISSIEELVIDTL